MGSAIVMKPCRGIKYYMVAIQMNANGIFVLACRGVPERRTPSVSFSCTSIKNLQIVGFPHKPDVSNV